MSNQMTNREYIDMLVKLAGVKHIDSSVFDRQLNITVAMDNYGHPSTAVIAFEGSPPRLEVIFSVIPFWNDVLIIRGNVIRAGKKERILRFLRQFIESRRDEWNANVHQALEQSH
jgi:hypothetical protein